MPIEIKVLAFSDFLYFIQLKIKEVLLPFLTSYYQYRITLMKKMYAAALSNLTTNHGFSELEKRHLRKPTFYHNLLEEKIPTFIAPVNKTVVLTFTEKHQNIFIALRSFMRNLTYLEWEVFEEFIFRRKRFEARRFMSQVCLYKDFHGVSGRFI
jgi:hypothetical protein